MQLIKNQQIIDDNWRSVQDDEALGVGNVVVSLTRWRQDKQQILNHQDGKGVKLSPEDSVAELADDLCYWQLIELNFPDFADGRLFSLAWLLRERYHFQGEIRATGGFMPDQAFYLARVGVDAFQPENSDCLPITLQHLQDFSVSYQDSSR